MLKQRGLSLVNLIVGLAVVGFLGVMAAKLMPAYIEYFQAKKILSTMAQAGDLKNSVRDIRKSFETRNAIEDVAAVKGEGPGTTRRGGAAGGAASGSPRVGRGTSSPPRLHSPEPT